MAAVVPGASARRRLSSAPELRQPGPSAVILACFLLTASCRPTDSRSGTSTLEAEDVASPIEIPTEDDIQEKPREKGLAGVLPENFPGDLPIFLPSSLVDFGPAGAGFFVDLLTPSAASAVSADLRTRLRETGWRLSDHGTGTLQLEKGGRQVKLTISGDHPGTRFRYEY
ncbi:MAG: hypothetical protein MI919_21260 [Holophagales bacterium]|nr:hypothetical protein [Holophagales bacterium]